MSRGADDDSGLERLGPCRIVRRLGAGGAGTVYEAELVEARPFAAAGKRVALKVLHTRLSTQPEAFARFEREVAVGIRIDHPGVVRTFEAGRERVAGAVRQFLIMEYVEGRTLAATIAEYGVVPEPLVRDIGRQVALGLSAIHRAGAVHRDLKPANILINPGSIVKILDLGIARLITSGQTLTGVGQFAGTLLYAAPERLRGEPLGPHADLYALGVVLYESATGVQPFDSDDVQVVLRRHLDEVPTGAAKLNPRISPFLEQLLARLLAKEPQHRFSSASELAEVLERGELSSWWRETEAERTVLARGRLHRIRVAREAPLVGRRRELSELLRWYGETTAGQGRVVWIEGEAGVGKTRLVDALIAALDERGSEYHFMYGAHAPGTTGGERGAVADAVVGHFGRTALASSLRRHLGNAPALASSFAGLLANEQVPEGVPGIEASVREALFCKLAKSLASERPVVWVVEDLHFAGEGDWSVLLSLARIAQDRRILLIATSRGDAVADASSALARVGVLRRLRVERLVASEVEELMSQTVVDPTAATRWAAAVNSRSDGNPLFVLALARELPLTPTSDGVGEQVPASVRAYLIERLSALSDDERSLLDLAANQGFAFDPDLLARALGQPRLMVLQTLAEVERRTGLVRATGAGYEFDHHLLQELLDDEQTPDLRAWHHGILAAAFEHRSSELGVDATDGESATFLAIHYARGERVGDATRFVLGALRHLAAHERGETLIALASRMTVQGAVDDLALLCELHLALAERLHMLGRREEEAAAIDAAIGAARTLGDPVREGRCLLARGRYQRVLGELDAARATLEESLSMAIDPATEARASLLLGVVLLAATEFDLAQQFLQRSADLCRERRNLVGQGDACRHLGRLAVLRNRYPEARSQLDAALALYRRAEDRAGEGHVQGAIGVLLTQVGEERAARPRFDEHLRLSRETGRRAAEASALQQLGYNAAQLGRPDEAERLSRQAVAQSREIGAHQIELAATFDLGRLWLQTGRLDRARESFERNASRIRELRERRWEASAEIDLGILLLAEGRLVEAADRLEASRALATERGMPGQALRAARELAEVAEAQGRVDDAHALQLESLAGSEQLGERGSVALSAIGLGRVLLTMGRADHAVQHLRAADQYARSEMPAFLGSLAGAYLAVAEARDVRAIEPADGEWVFVQVETRLALAAAGVGAQLVVARQQLEAVASHLGEAERRIFWSANRLSRRLAQLESGEL